jgi:ATP-dependent RNA helicase DHX36
MVGPVARRWLSLPTKDSGELAPRDGSNAPMTAQQFAQLMSSGEVGPENAVAWFSSSQESGASPAKNVEYYNRLRNYPRAVDYPKLPLEIFRRPLTAGQSDLIYDILAKVAQVATTEELVKRHDPEGFLWRLLVHVSFEDNHFIAIGEHEDKAKARIAASMHILHQLHGTRLLSNFSNPEATSSDTILSDELPEEPDLWSKLHVYSYAAHFMTLPYFKFESTADGQVLATLSIPKLNFCITAHGKSEEHAETLACIKFKEAAEERQKGTSEKPLMLGAGHGVNLDNAKDILAFYEWRHTPDVIYWDIVKDTSDNDFPQFGKRYSITPFWRGRQLCLPTMMRTRSSAKQLASLATAVTLVNRQPSLLSDYGTAVQQNGGFAPRHIVPTCVALGQSAERFLEEAVAKVEVLVESNEPNSQAEWTHLSQPRDRRHWLDERSGAYTRRWIRQHSSLNSRSAHLKTKQEMDMQDPSVQERKSEAFNLPIHTLRAEILTLVKNNLQSIIVGTAGSGKSTQVPQIILDDAIAEGRGALCNIIHIQPRRDAAAEMALRLSYERNSTLREIVGYHVAGIYRLCDLDGSINFITPDIVTMQLEHRPDEIMDNTSHIIIDEVHELNQAVIRLMTVLKMAFTARMKRGASIPKLILMSATLDSEIFESYFELIDSAGRTMRPPVCVVPGRQFPIEEKYLEGILQEIKGAPPSSSPELTLNHLPTQKFVAAELSDSHTSQDHDGLDRQPPPILWESQLELSSKLDQSTDSLGLVAATIAHVAKTTDDGDILVFLAGWSDILDVQKLLYSSEQSLDLTDPSKFAILQLHSANPAGVGEAMKKVQPGCRRILLSSNIAETSLTFPDAKYVIDGGQTKNKMYSEISLRTPLRRKWINKSHLTQRAGRVGRVQPGKYYGLFSEHREKSMTPFPSPNALDLPDVEATCLRARRHFPEVPVRKFMSRLLESPPTDYIEAAIANLRAWDALAEDEQITDVGRALNHLVLVPPAMGRMLLLAILFRCADPLIAMAALRNNPQHFYDSLLTSSFLREDIDTHRQLYAQGSRSDIIAMVNIYADYLKIKHEEGVEVASQWASQHQLVPYRLDVVDELERNIGRMLTKLGYIDREGAADRSLVNTRSGNQGLLKSLIMTGLRPNLAVHHHNHLFHTESGMQARLWDASLVRSLTYQRPATHFQPGKGSTTVPPLNGSVCCYHDLRIRSNSPEKNVIAGTSPVPSLGAIIFSNSLALKEDDDSVLVVDGWLPFQVSGGGDAARLLLRFKKVCDEQLNWGLQQLCGPKQSAKSPALDLLLQTVADLLEYDEMRWQKHMDLLEKSR